MSAGTFLVILVAAVALLMLLILRFKIHPVLAIFFVTFGLAVALGNDPLTAIQLINTGFGSTLTSIGIVIILGSIIAMGIQDTGGAASVANAFLRLFRGRNTELGPSMAAFILSIPVFGDITMILLAPISSIIAHRRKMSMSTMAAFVGLGLFLTHSLVPPTPGILAITIQLGADLGQVIVWGLIISLIAFFVTWLLLRKWVAKEHIDPKPEFIAAELEGGASEITDIIEGKNLPPTWHALLPLLAPVVLIASASFGNAFLPEGSLALKVLKFFGDKVVALLCGAFAAMSLVIGRKDMARERIMAQDPSLSPSASFVEMLFNSWVKRALNVAIVPLLVTAMGGAFGQVLAKAPAAQELAKVIAGSSIPAVIIPWIIGVAMMTSVGSITMAQLTAAALVQPLLPQLGIPPLVAVLAAGAGAMSLNHVNNSGFWVMSSFYNLKPQQGLKYVTVPSALASVVSLILLIILTQIGILH